MIIIVCKIAHFSYDLTFKKPAFCLIKSFNQSIEYIYYHSFLPLYHTSLCSLFYVSIYILPFLGSGNIFFIEQ